MPISLILHLFLKKNIILVCFLCCLHIFLSSHFTPSYLPNIWNETFFMSFRLNLLMTLCMTSTQICSTCVWIKPIVFNCITVWFWRTYNKKKWNSKSEIMVCLQKLWMGGKINILIKINTKHTCMRREELTVGPLYLIPWK